MQTNRVSLSEGCKDLNYKLPHSETVFVAQAVSFTSTIIIFLTEMELLTHTALEIIINADHRFMPQIKAYVEVSCCKQLDNGCYEIECEIKGIKDNL